MRNLLPILCAALLLVGCAGSQLEGPRSASDYLDYADRTTPMVSSLAHFACDRMDEGDECHARVIRDTESVEHAMKIARVWLPILEEALKDGDELREREAREHLRIALELVPEAYAEIAELGKNLPSLRK